MADVIMMAITIVAIGVMNVFCFMIGAKVGQSVSKGETVEIPKPDPFKAVVEQRERREQQREADKYEIMMQNVDNYNGSDRGQKDIP